MGRPFLLAQLSDLHLGGKTKAGVKPEAGAADVIAALAGLPNPVDAIVVTGDLAAHGKRREYRLARELFAGLGVPVHVLAGNNDKRGTMREAFALPGEADAPIDYAVDLGPLDLVVVDSTIPGEDPGDFEPAQLRRLDATLSANAGKPTILAMHHPPLPTAVPDWDRVNMAAAERDALAAAIAPHPHVRAIVAGHLHRVTFATLAGRPVISGPSTYVQAHPDFRTEAVEVDGSPPGFAIHALRGEELSSQIEAIPRSR